jgi:hypothetical protein
MGWSNPFDTEPQALRLIRKIGHIGCSRNGFPNAVWAAQAPDLRGRRKQLQAQKGICRRIRP